MKESAPLTLYVAYTAKPGCRETFVRQIVMEGIADTIVSALAEQKGIDLGSLGHFDPERHKQEQYDLLADTLLQGLDMDYICKVLNREV